MLLWVFGFVFVNLRWFECYFTVWCFDYNYYLLGLSVVSGIAQVCSKFIVSWLGSGVILKTGLMLPIPKIIERWEWSFRLLSVVETIVQEINLALWMLCYKFDSGKKWMNLLLLCLQECEHLRMLELMNFCRGLMEMPRMIEFFLLLSRSFLL